MAVLQDVGAMQKEIEALRAQLAQKNKLSAKVSEKGAISVYGLHSRFPVTLYAEQWERLFASIDMVKATIKTGDDAGLVTRRNGASK